MLKFALVLIVCGGCCQALNLELTSSMLTDNMWDGLMERVDRYILPVMPYWYEELEPHHAQAALTAHHMGEHNVIKSYMNHFLEEWRKKYPDSSLAFDSILNIVMNLDKVPEEYQADMRFYGGGFVNHCFYFGTLSPNPDSEERAPTGYLLDEINENFGGLEGLKKEIDTYAQKVRGSGYVWLVRLPGKEGIGSLRVMETQNQDSPIMSGMHPILVVDMWEHAYYLKHNYKRWEHLKDFWMVLNWAYVERLDKWWQNIEEEQKKADERVATFKKSLDERMAQAAADEELVERPREDL